MLEYKNSDFPPPYVTVILSGVDAITVPCTQSSFTTGIVVSLGGKTKDVGATMLTDGTTNVINAMKAAGIDKDGECFFSLFWLFWLFWLSSYGQLV